MGQAQGRALPVLVMLWQDIFTEASTALQFGPVRRHILLVPEQVQTLPSPGRRLPELDSRHLSFKFEQCKHRNAFIALQQAE
jgi:hypothetical protein